MASIGIMNKSPVFNGDTVILYCSESSGHIYCEPRSSLSTPLTVFPQLTEVPQFPNVHFAVFRITHVKPTLKLSDTLHRNIPENYEESQSTTAEDNYDLMTTVACGSTVKLQHIASKKFLTISSSSPAWLGETSNNSIFRLLPARHEKSWGEDMYYGDSLRLESVYHKGQRIQCVYNPLTSRYNLVLAVTGSIITVRSHCPRYSTINPQHIRGGEVVTLKWQKIEGYMSVKGSFVTESLPPELKVKPKVGLRRWRARQWQLRANPSSADTYFQLEKASQPSSGECFLFGDCCRIKHLSTQKYLASKIVMKNHTILLNDSIDTSGIDVFRLLPVDKKLLSKPISSNDQILFENIKSGRVLSVNARRNLQRDLSSRQHDPLSQWFDLKFDTLCEDITENYPFTLQKVDEDGIMDVYHVIGIALLLTKCVSKLKTGGECDFDIDNVLKSFKKEVEEQMNQMKDKLQSSLNTKRLANMFRILQVVDAMMVLLSSIGIMTETSRSISLSVCSALKKYAESANKKSRVRLADKQFLHTLLSMVGKEVDVEGVLVALVKDDNEMSRTIKAQVSAGHITTENPQVLDLLRFLGFNSNVEVRNKILERTRQECNVENFDCKNDINFALEAFIEQSVQEEAENHLVLHRDSFTFDFGMLSMKIEVHISDPYGNLTKMELRIKNFLKQQTLHDLYAGKSFMRRNGIILEMLEAVYFLCERNVYINNDHTDEVTKHLVEILRGSTDGIGPDEPFRGNERFNLSKLPGNEHVFKVKIQVLQILHFLLNQHLKASLKQVLWDFKYLYLKQRERVYSSGSHDQLGETILEEPEDNAREDNASMMNILELEKSQGDETDMVDSQTEDNIGIEFSGAFVSNTRNERSRTREEIELELLSEYDHIETTADDIEEPLDALHNLLKSDADITEMSLRLIAQRRLRQLYRRGLAPRFDTDMSQEICKVLLDILDYNDGDLQLECAELLYDLFSVETKILNMAEKSYFVTPYSYGDKQEQMIAVGTISDKEQLLGKMLKMQCTDVPKLINTLKTFGDWCVEENDETKPDVVIQGVAYSSGLFSIVLEYVLEYGPSDYYDQENILRACFYLLQRIARRNSRVQKKLFKYFHDLMGTKIAVSSMTMLLNEIFSYNRALCEKLTETDIQQLFYTMIASSNPEHFELTLTLRAIIESTPTATSLQENISQLMVDYWSDNLGYLLGSENQVTRFNLLKQDSDNEPELILLLNITNMLATCTEGECRFAEEVSRSFFPLDELLSVLLDSDIPIHRKIPFARLITWTYLNTERDSLVCCIRLAKCSDFWAHIEFMSTNIDRIVKLIAKLKPKEKKPIETKLRALNRLYINVNGWMIMSDDLNKLDRTDDHSQEVDSLNLPFNALLIYILEGILPLISAFCSEFALHLSGLNDSCTSVDLQLPVLIEMGKSLVGFHRTKVLVSSGHINRLKTCFEDMSGLFTIKGVNDQQEVNSVLGSMKSEALVRNRAFSQNNILDSENPETQLNDAFQIYVDNYRKAYEEEIDPSSNERGLSIPRGPSFRKIIELFTDADETLQDPEKSLKVEKLLQLLHTLVKKQKRQGLQSLEKPKLEAITLFTLQVLFCVVNEQIKRVPRGEPVVFRQQYMGLIFPLQQRLLEKGAPELLIGILQHAREDVAFQVLACLNVLLYSGNEEAQKKISELINEESRGIFVRVHQILTTAQSSLTQAKMTKVLNQFTAAVYDPSQDLDTDDDRIAIKILRRNKSAVVSGFSFNAEDDSDLPDPPIAFSSRRKTADVELLPNPSAYYIPGMETGTAGKSLAAHSSVDHRITVALNLLSWLCDGQKRNMQDILREQKLFASFSIVSQVAFLFHGIVENLNEENIQIAQCAVQSLIEMCAGNYENQELAFKGQVVISIDQILPEGFTSRAGREAMLKLKCSAIELLEVMIEETSVNSPQLGKWVFSHLDLCNFLFAMKEIWDDYTSLLHISNKDFLEKSVFRAYHVLRRIADYKGTTANKLVGYNRHYEETCQFRKFFGESYPEARSMWHHCRFWSKSIEVIYVANNGDKILTHAYFYYDPHKNLNEHEKNAVLMKIKRNTPEEKLTDLLFWTKAIREYHSWKEHLKKHPVAKWIIKAATIRHLILYSLTIFLNLLILFSLSAPNDYDPQAGSCSVDENTTNCLYFQPILNPSAPSWYYILKYIFGSIHSILSLWMLLQHLLKNWKSFTFKIPSVSLILYDLKKGVLRRRYFYKMARLANRYLCCGKYTAYHPVARKYFQTSFFSFEPIYRIMFTLFSLAGLIFSGYFYCGCMFYIFLKNSVLQYILKAVGKSALQLLTVFILGLVVVYIYAVISFALVSNYFNPEEDQFCQTLFQCFITITRIGLLDTLGPSVPVRPYPNYDPNFRVVGVRTVYDLLFFIVVTTLGVNIVIAILVDQFSNLREDQEKIDDDNNSRCLICSIPKDAFESSGLDFHKHWRKDHNVWNYIHYALYLDSVHENDHNALEKHIYEQIPRGKKKSGSIEFYPLRRAKCLPNYDQNQEKR